MIHINSTGDFAWRADLYERVGEQLGENTKAGAIDGACEFTEQMLPNLERAMDHPDMTEELVKILSTNLVRLEYRIETDVRIGDGECACSCLYARKSLRQCDSNDRYSITGDGSSETRFKHIASRSGGGDIDKEPDHLRPGRGV